MITCKCISIHHQNCVDLNDVLMLRIIIIFYLLSTVVLNGRDRQGSRFPAKKLRTKSRLAKPSRRFSSIVLQK